MNKQDQAAFEKWFNDSWKSFSSGVGSNSSARTNCEKAYQAALSHERQRSAKLVELLKIAIEDWWDIKQVWVDDAEEALKEYYASGEGER